MYQPKMAVKAKINATLIVPSEAALITGSFIAFVWYSSIAIILKGIEGMQ